MGKEKNKRFKIEQIWIDYMRFWEYEWKYRCRIKFKKDIDDCNSDWFTLNITQEESDNLFNLVKSLLWDNLEKLKNDILW